MLFSQRKGLKPVRSLAQKDSIDEDLRYGLWDAFHVNLWKKLEYHTYHNRFPQSNLWPLFERYWHGYFKRPLDNLPETFHAAHEVVRQYFFQCEWHEIYDFIEFTAAAAPDNLAADFSDFCNCVLERELSAYRLIDGRMVEITAEQEIASVEEALKSTEKLKGVHAHLTAALALLSDRKKPDFRNSIKESISAVEAVAQLLTGDSKATLGAALKVLETKSSMHGALKASLSSLYGYTSDAGGIRHAMLDESTLKFNDAKFMLVACTAFVNYLVGKAAEEGVRLR
jgi:hypothetical protein